MSPGEAIEAEFDRSHDRPSTAGILNALERAGFVIVPRKPTPAMRRAVAADWGRKTWAQFAEVLDAADGR